MSAFYNISVTDMVIIGLYFVIIILVGIRYRKSADAESYFLAGRGMTWPIIGFSMFATSISSSTLIGQSGDAYSTGIAVFNYNLMSILVMVIFAWFFLPFYIKSRIFTLPEFLERRFDAKSRYYFSAVTILINIFLDAAGGLYAAALVIKLIFPEMEIATLAIIFAVIVALYTIPGGLSSAIRVDLMQGVMLTVGAIILTVIISARGGSAYIADRIHSGDIMMKLVRPLDDPSVPWLGMILGIPVLGFFFWGNNQSLVQRALTAKSVDEARKGVLLVGLLTLITLFIIIIPGVMAKQFFPGLERPDMVYPSLVIKMLPVGVVGFMLAALIAALTSTLSGLLNSVATLFTMDFYAPNKKNAQPKQMVMVGRIVSALTLVIAVWWAPQIGTRFSSLLKYYQEMLAMLAPPIVASFILGVFWKRINSTGNFAGLIAGAALGLGNLIFKAHHGVSLFGDIHFLLTVPIYLVFSMLIMIIVSYLTKEPDMKKIAPYIWTREIFREESLELKQVPFYKNYRILSYMLIGLCVVVLILFR
ncbi:MAG: sodium:solute symporter family transporter [Bacteroidota bacterium]